MPMKRKVYLAREWLYHEFKDRNLPFILQTPDKVTGACMNDVSIFLHMAGYKISEDGKTYDYVGDDEDTVIDVEIDEYLSIVNLLANRFPAFYYFEYNLKNALYNLYELLKCKPNRVLVSYIKKTIKNLKQLEKEINELDEGFVKELKKD